MTTTSASLEPHREKIMSRYLIHDLTPDQVVRYLNFTGIHTDIHVVKHCLREWGVPFEHSALDIELEAPPKCDNRLCTRTDDMECITWRTLSDLPDPESNTKIPSLLTRWLMTQDRGSALASDEAIPIDTQNFHPQHNHPAKSNLFTNIAAPSGRSLLQSPSLQPTTPITISSLLSPKDTPVMIRHHDASSFPYPKREIPHPPAKDVVGTDERRDSACLLSPQSHAGPVRTKSKLRERKRPTVSTTYKSV